MTRLSRTIHIEHLDLDLRGVSPADAEAAVRQLGPALQVALGSGLPHQKPATGAHETIRVAAGASPGDLARTIANYLAGAIRLESDT